MPALDSYVSGLQANTLSSIQVSNLLSSDLTSQFLVALSANTSLKTLNFNNSPSLGDSAIQLLLNALSSNTGISGLVLSLQNTGCSDVGGGGVAGFIKNANAGLINTIALDNNPLISDTSGSLIAQAVPFNTGPALVSTNANIARLSSITLSSCNIGNATLDAFGVALMPTSVPSLVNLDFSNNLKVTDAGMQKFLVGLQANPTLQTLGLAGNTLSSSILNQTNGFLTRNAPCVMVQPAICPMIIKCNVNIDPTLGSLTPVTPNNFLMVAGQEGTYPSPSSSVFNVTQVSGGYFCLMSNPTVPITTFTQAQVNTGNTIAFYNTGPYGQLPSFTIAGKRGGSIPTFASTVGTVNFTVAPTAATIATTTQPATNATTAATQAVTNATQAVTSTTTTLTQAITNATTTPTTTSATALTNATTALTQALTNATTALTQAMTANITTTTQPVTSTTTTQTQALTNATAALTQALTNATTALTQAATTLATTIVQTSTTTTTAATTQALTTASTALTQAMTNATTVLTQAQTTTNATSATQALTTATTAAAQTLTTTTTALAQVLTNATVATTAATQALTNATAALTQAATTSTISTQSATATNATSAPSSLTASPSTIPANGTVALNATRTPNITQTGNGSVINATNFSHSQNNSQIDIDATTGSPSVVAASGLGASVIGAIGGGVAALIFLIIVAAIWRYRTKQNGPDQLDGKPPKPKLLALTDGSAADPEASMSEREKRATAWDRQIRRSQGQAASTYLAPYSGLEEEDHYAATYAACDPNGDDDRYLVPVVRRENEYDAALGHHSVASADYALATDHGSIYASQGDTTYSLATDSQYASVQLKKKAAEGTAVYDVASQDTALIRSVSNKADEQAVYARADENSVYAAASPKQLPARTIISIVSPQPVYDSQLEDGDALYSASPYLPAANNHLPADSNLYDIGGAGEEHYAEVPNFLAAQNSATAIYDIGASEHGIYTAPPRPLKQHAVAKEKAKKEQEQFALNYDIASSESSYADPRLLITETDLSSSDSSSDHYDVSPGELPPEGKGGRGSDPGYLLVGSDLEAEEGSPQASPAFFAKSRGKKKAPSSPLRPDGWPVQAKGAQKSPLVGPGSLLGSRRGLVADPDFADHKSENFQKLTLA